MLLVAAFLILAQDVFVPPVPIGVGRDAKVRTVKKPIPFPRETDTWLRVRTPHFDVISNANEKRTREIAGDLESLAAALTTSVSRFQVARHPTTIFVFARRRESQPYFELLTGVDRTKVSGLYVRHGSGGAMFIDGSTNSFARTATHELIHDLLRQGDVTPPLWIEEGLAEYIAHAHVTRKGVFGGAHIPQHAKLLARSANAKMEDMFAVKAESPAAHSSLFYAQSWSAVHWLMRADAKAFFPFLHDLERGMPIADALHEHYGKSLEDLRRGIGDGGWNAAPVRLAEHAREITAASAVLDRPTLLYELGSFLSHVAGAEQETQRHYREALRLNPKHARTLAALGEFDAALAADPRDAELPLLYAESLLGPAVGDFAGVFEPANPERFAKARELAERALSLGADEARARGAIGVSHSGAAGLAPGIAALERARELAPWRMDYAIHLYSMYLRSGARDKAAALYTAAFENARDKQVVFAAANVRLDAETQRANELAQSGKLDEAAALVREIASTISDADERGAMERQAAHIESVALTNRHIKMYNDAIQFSNAGRHRDALKVLDELLAVAKDPDVVRDAQRLRKELAGR